MRYLCKKAPPTQEEVEKAFFEIGYQLLSKYENNYTKLNFRCDKGHEHSIEWRFFQQGVRCGICSNSIALKQKDIEQAFSEIGYTLLSEYKNTRTKLKFRCDKGHEHSITWSNFQQGVRCGICWDEYRKKNNQTINLYYMGKLNDA